MKSRIKNIYDRINKELDAIFIYNSTKPHVDMTFYYVTGLVVGEYEGCGAVLYPDYSAEIMVSALEAESAAKADIPMSTIKKREEREEWMEDKLSDLDTIGVNASELTYSGYKKIKEASDADIIDISDEIAEARNIKDEKEIEFISTACGIASDAAEEIIEYVEPGVKEYELAAEISYIMKKKGATGDAFDIIASSGPNTAEPHYTAGEREVRGGFRIVRFRGSVQTLRFRYH